MSTVGVLALQGDFALHAQALEQLGVAWRLIRNPEALSDLSGLILPGGESSTLLKLMAPADWSGALIQFHQQGKILFGTCCGLILLANQVEPNQHSLKLIDIDVERNAYGRQLDSFHGEGQLHLENNPQTALPMTFIRAPKITRCGEQVQILATQNKQPVWVRQNNVVVASFHPEMGNDRLVHRYFADLLT